MFNFLRTLPRLRVGDDPRVAPVLQSTLKILLVAALFFTALFTLPVTAQEPPPQPVTFDEVNAVAKRMFCPVCENEPLDTCAAQACIQWRAEIREQLTQGRTPDEIVSFFISEYGDQVVGIPQNPTLRALSLIGPVVVTLLALVVGVWTFLRWRSHAPTDQTPPPSTGGHGEDDEYRSRLERDLQL